MLDEKQAWFAGVQAEREATLERLDHAIGLMSAETHAEPLVYFRLFRCWVAEAPQPKKSDATS